MATTTAAPQASTDQAIVDLIRAKDTRDSIARTIANNVTNDVPVIPALRSAYILASVVVASAEDAFLTAFNAQQVAS